MKTDKWFNRLNLTRFHLAGTAAIIAIAVVLSIVIWPVNKFEIEANHDKILSIKLKEIDPQNYVLGVYQGWLDLKKNTLILIEKPSDDSPNASGISYYDKNKHLLISGRKNDDQFFFRYLKSDDPVWEVEIFTYLDLMQNDKLIFKGKTSYKGMSVHQLDTKEKQYDSDPNDGKSDGPQATYYLDVKTKMPIVKITDPLNISGGNESGRHRIDINTRIVEKGSLDPKIFTLFDIKKIKNKIINFPGLKNISKIKSDLKKLLTEDSNTTFSNIDDLYYLGAQFKLNNKPSDFSSITIASPSTISLNYRADTHFDFARGNNLVGRKFDINFTPLKIQRIRKKWKRIVTDINYTKQNIKGDKVYIKSSIAFLVKDGNLVSITRTPNDTHDKRKWDILTKSDLITLIKNLKKF